MKALRSNPIVWPILLAPCALILGYVGYRSVGGVGMSRSDALFSSLQLFGLEGSPPPQGTPLALNVARFLAPTVVTFAAVITIVTVLRDQVQRALLATFARGHVVLVGLTHDSSLLTASLVRTGQRVVVVEADRTNARIPGARAAGGTVLVGDGTQEVILRRAQAPKARHVVVSTGDDSRNLEVAECMRRLALDEGRGTRTTVHVEVSDPVLWTELGRLHVARLGNGPSLEFFNVVDRTAQALLDEAERAMGPAIFGDVVLEGEGDLAVRALVHLVRRAALVGKRPRIQVSESVRLKVAELHRWLDRGADLTDERTDTVDGSDELTVLVCVTDSDAAALASALVHSKSRSARGIFVSVDGQQNDALLNLVGVSERIHLVPANIKAMTDQFLVQSGPELMARVRHEEYVARQRELGVTLEENSSMVPWEELPESLKESNRRFAESVGEVIESLAGWLVPLRDLDAPPHPVFAAGEIFERLATDEHDRWMGALTADGWTYSPAPKDPEQKTHPLLVTWAELPEHEKEKDRDAIRAIPRMLARVGFAIELPPEGTSKEDGSEEDARLLQA